MPRSRAVTLKDVAQRAGVSLMTVSAVLNGKAAERRISDETRDRVRRIAETMDYRPNAIARSLRRKSTNVIGVYSGIGYLNATNPFLSELIGGLQEGCDLHKKDLLLHGTFRGLSAGDIYDELLDGRLDGLIVQALPSDPLVERLAASHLPVFAVADAIPSVPSIVADDPGGMAMLMDHLAGRGHRRIVHISPRMMIESAARRRAAVYAAAARHQMEVRECSTGPSSDYTATPIDGWLREPPDRRPTAAVVWSDTIAYEFIGYCQSRGIRMPEDLAVTGFDGFALPAAASLRLTTVRAPWNEVGRRAVAMLVAHLEGREVPSETVLPVEFQAGNTA